MMTVKTKLLVMALVLAAGVIGFASLLGSKSPEDVCRIAFETKFGDEFTSFQVKEKTWNSISFDLNGYYSNGEWSCALGNNPVEFKSGILFPRDAQSEWFDESGLE